VAPGDQPVFYYDFNSPFAWLAAERINQVMPTPPVWRPISFSHVLQHSRRLPWSVTDEREAGIQEIERRAKERGLPEIRWPEGWPIETVPLAGLRAATFAADIGKSVSFSLAAYRQTFHAARPMNELDNVLLAGAACELHPNAIKAALERDAIKQKLKDNTNEAIELGIHGVPTVAVGTELFWGDDQLEAAASAAS
jgi:2-hydroxychromene-2-carboxylate isomerase